MGTNGRSSILGHPRAFQGHERIPHTHTTHLGVAFCPQKKIKHFSKKGSYPIAPLIDICSIHACRFNRTHGRSLKIWSTHNRRLPLQDCPLALCSLVCVQYSLRTTMRRPIDEYKVPAIRAIASLLGPHRTCPLLEGVSNFNSESVDHATHSPLTTGPTTT